MATKKNKKVSVGSVQQAALESNVVVKIKQGNRTIKTFERHNTATLNLYYSVALALRNALGSESVYLPRYLCAGTGVYTDVSRDERLQTKLVNPISMILPPLETTGSPKKDEGNSSASPIIPPNATTTFLGIIPYRLIQDTRVRELGIYGSNSNGGSNDTMLARVQFDEPLPALEIGQSLYVEWTFAISGVISQSIPVIDSTSSST